MPDSGLKPVPTGWTSGRVGQLGEVQAGKARDMRSNADLRPYLRVANVFDGRIDVGDVFQMPFTDDEFERFRLRRGDVLLNEGQSLELVGRCSMYRDEFGAPCAIQNALIRFRAGAEVTSDFAEHLFRWCQQSGVFASIATQTTSIAHLGVSRLSNLEVLLPPLPEQRKIAAILSSVDDAIDKTQAVIDQLAVVKKAMMQELLTKGLPGRHTKFKKTEIGMVPEEWEVLQLGRLLEGIDAGWSPQCDGVPASLSEWGVLKVSAVSWGAFRPDENKRLPAGLEPRPGIEVREGDVLISRANTPDLVGRSVLVRSTRPQLMLSDKLLRLRVGNRAAPAFVNLCLETPTSRAQIVDGATGSSKSMKNISQAALREVVVPVPPIDEQKHITALVEALDMRMGTERLALGSTGVLKSALMSVLLTGEVRVTPDVGV